MKKLLLISILALNYNVVQAAVDMGSEFKKLPPPKNDAEVTYLQNIKDSTGARLMVIEAVFCQKRPEIYLIQISNSLLQLNIEYMDNLLKASPTSQDYMWKVINVSDNLANNPHFTQQDCINFVNNGGLKYVDKVYAASVLGL